jgi:hypothetical protein
MFCYIGEVFYWFLGVLFLIVLFLLQAIFFLPCSCSLSYDFFYFLKLLSYIYKVGGGDVRGRFA